MLESIFNSTVVLTGLLVVPSEMSSLKTERGGSREFGNGVFPSALALPSL